MSAESERNDLGRKHQFHGVQPVPPVGDVAATAEYFRRVLGFDIDFLEGEPPVHGRVNKGDGSWGQPVYIHLSKAAPEDVRASGELRIQVGHDPTVSSKRTETSELRSSSRRSRSRGGFASLRCARSMGTS